MSLNAVSNMGIGTNYASLYNDPYFIKAFNSPNINQQQANNIGLNPANTTTNTNTAINPSFKGASENIKGEKKKGNGAKWILGTLTVAGIAFAGYKCFKKGDGEGIAKIWDGAKKYFTGATNTVKNTINGNNKMTDEIFTIAKNGDDILCTIPGKTNVIKGEHLDDVARLGSKVDMPALTDKATEILKFEAKLSDNSSIIVRGNKLQKLIDANGNNVSLDKLSDLEKEEVNKIITAVKNKDKSILKKLRNVIGRQTENGITRSFVTQATKTAKNGVRKATTKKFLVDSTAVKAYRQQNPQLSEAIEEFGKDVVSKFKINTAEKATDIGTFKIVGDKIAGIQTATGYYPVDSQNYRALLFDNKEIFDSVLSDPKKFTNIVYRVA